MLTDTPPARARALANLPLAEFVTRWRQIVGEPPAAMLENRSEMIRLLVEGAPPASGAPQTFEAKVVCSEPTAHVGTKPHD